MKTNEVSFYKTNEVSFAKTLTGIYSKKHILLREGGTEGFGHPAAYSLRVLHSMVLFVALAAALSGMAHAAQQVPAPGATKGAEQATSTSSGQAFPVVDVYKSPQCGCCKAWAEHLQKNGFTVILHDVDDVPAARKKLGMPTRFGSRHAAHAGGHLVQGPLPATDGK